MTKQRVAQLNYSFLLQEKEIGFECKLVWLKNSLFPYDFKHSISRAIIFS